MLTNYHCHGEFCDGRDSLADMAKTAHHHGFTQLGFSAHAPLPFPTTWNIRRERVADYTAEVGRLKAEYSGRMEILLGYELDWIKGVSGPGLGWDQLERDFALASVHFVRAPDGFLFTVDEGEAEFFPKVAEHYQGRSLDVVRDYWQAYQEMVQVDGYQILGHLDLIKKNNRDSRLFDPEAKEHRHGALATVEAIAARGKIVEVNTGGMARGKIHETYPSPWILAKMHTYRIPVTLNSDAHQTANLMAFREEGLAALRQAGYRETYWLERGEWKAKALD